jgi:hypothetical protein
MRLLDTFVAFICMPVLWGLSFAIIGAIGFPGMAFIAGLTSAAPAAMIAISVVYAEFSVDRPGSFLRGIRFIFISSWMLFCALVATFVPYTIVEKVSAGTAALCLLAFALSLATALSWPILSSGLGLKKKALSWIATD